MIKNCLHILFIIILFTGCSKNDNSNIPLVPVNLNIHVNDPAYITITVTGGWTYVNGGSRGIIIYRLSNDKFKAYDRHCTYDSSNSCALVSVDLSNITGLDDCCGSKFILTDGSVTNGPASLPLKQYQTSFDGSTLRIFN
jgi:nitrite reductase/ring-hydroxylating ferredoxin subunit